MNPATCPCWADVGVRVLGVTCVIPGLLNLMLDLVVLVAFDISGATITGVSNWTCRVISQVPTG